MIISPGGKEGDNEGGNHVVKGDLIRLLTYNYCVMPIGNDTRFYRSEIPAPRLWMPSRFSWT